MRLAFSTVFFIGLFVLASTACDSCAFFDSGNTDAGPGDLGVGKPCGSDSQCRAGLACKSNTCQPTGTGTAGTFCTLTGDCMDGLWCGPSRSCETAGDGTEGSGCTSTAQCAHGLVCAADGFYLHCQPGGDGDLGNGCMNETDCLAGLSCVAGQCASTPAQMLPDGGQPPPSLPLWTGVTCEDDTGPARAYFEVPSGGMPPHDFYRLPFPNDVRRTADGHIDLTGHPHPGTAVSFDVIDRYLRASEEDLDGFSTNPVVFFRFSKPYDWDTIGGTLRIVDITPASPDYDHDTGISWLTTGGAITRYICPNWLALRPPHGEPLRPQTTYVALVTKGVKATSDAGGATFAPDADLTALLSSSMPTDARLSGAWNAYAPLRAWLTDSGTDPSTILDVAVFTTESTQSIIPKLREVIRGRPAPTVSDITVCDTGVTSPCDDGTDLRRCSAADPSYVEIQGHIELPIFQQGTEPYLDPSDGGGIQTDASGTPMVARTEQVCFDLTVPRDVAPPSGGFPLLVAAHGTGGSFTTAVRGGLASAAADGMGTPSVQAATLAIDLPEHGARRGGSTTSPDELFYNFGNPRAARDNITQGAADLMSLAFFAEGFSMDAASSPTGQDLHFDPSRIVLFAHSQGATHASLMLPFEPAYRAAELSGDGGDLTLSLLNKTQPVDIAGVLPFALLDANGDGHLAGGEYHPVLALFQAFFDRVDPVNFGRLLQREPVDGSTGADVFMTYGLGDTYAPPPTLRAFAKSVGFTEVNPVLDDFGLTSVDPPLSSNVTIHMTMHTQGMRQYMPPAGVDGHFVALESDLGKADTTRFLLEALDGQVPEIGAAP